MNPPIVVVGAGLAGLVAAVELRAAGRDVVVVEAGPGVGGRLATARLDGATLDHGAQFFTVRSDAFASFVADRRPGLVYEWCQGFDPPDGYSRFAVRGGMEALAVDLATSLDVRVGTPVAAIEAGGDQASASKASAGGPPTWRVHAGGSHLDASAVLLTPPVPESLRLLERGGLGRLGGASGLGDIAYHRVLALLVTLNSDPAVPHPGGRQLASGPFSFVADNVRKGISPRPAVTFHTAHGLSGDLWDHGDEAVTAELLDAGRPWLGDAVVRASQLVRWRYSGPVQVWPEPCAVVAPGLVFAGDAFAGSKVEGAFSSGRAAAAALLAP